MADTLDSLGKYQKKPYDFKLVIVPRICAELGALQTALAHPSGH
jgi:hypothetical protein